MEEVVGIGGHEEARDEEHEERVMKNSVRCQKELPESRPQISQLVRLRQESRDLLCIASVQIAKPGRESSLLIPDDAYIMEIEEKRHDKARPGKAERE
jgi:hypothetical protein